MAVTTMVVVVTMAMARSDVEVDAARNPDPLAMTVSAMPMAAATPAHVRHLTVKLRGSRRRRSGHARDGSGGSRASNGEGASRDGACDQSVTKFHILVSLGLSDVRERTQRS